MYQTTVLYIAGRVQFHCQKVKIVLGLITFLLNIKSHSIICKNRSAQKAEKISTLLFIRIVILKIFEIGKIL